ncbi:hypothetical protein BHM03_00026778 [Ensete ventricosum]|uniref:Uncharacterized protein n=1 Tax=Ensete ventricosum TaxID=4639 RepID=A0A445MHD5_ENSVE|nr:hypothetical protein BHM03_00026778 [Ensete ventricosum]
MLPTITLAAIVLDRSQQRSLQQKATINDLSLQSVYIAPHNNHSLPTILIATSNKLNTIAAVYCSILLLPSSATAVYIAASSSAYCSHTLAATYATCSHEPYTLNAAISFARHQEERLNYEARKTRVAPRPTAPKLSPPPTFSRPPQPQKLTREDLHDVLTNGLCGCCDKLWSLEHKCKKATSLIIAPTKEPKLEDITLEPKEKDTPQLATRTVPTLAGYTNLQKLKIEGFLEQQSIIILINAGSTHNFMSSKVAAHLMLQKEDYNGFEVKVANV